MSSVQKIHIDWEDVAKLAAISSTLVEIAHWFSCSVDTLEQHCLKEKQMRLCDFYNKHYCEGNISIRRKQYQRAMEGDKTMLVWLGKQRLGQVDRMEHGVNATLDVKLKDEVKELFTQIELIAKDKSQWSKHLLPDPSPLLPPPSASPLVGECLKPEPQPSNENKEKSEVTWPT